jgi:hypothetical protein
MSAIEQLLEAGALLTAKQKVSSKEPVDDISARVYSHPGLDSPVVRLCADKLAQGDDLAMEFLGFAEPEVQGPVAKRRRQALGFPGWALINDPRHAKYALQLVKSMKKAARRAKSKPGRSYEEFSETCAKLGRSVAHFLPSYWEEVGRIFMDVGSQTFAARAFNKAREAEKVHALEVDEEMRRDAFLEFALAGCLSIKTLSEYGKELQKTQKPKEAWEFFRTLCLRRTLGGVPPYASMRKDLDRLIRNAKLDKTKEQIEFLAEISEAPAMIRAPESFWESYEAEATELVKSNAKFAGLLLNMIPDWGYWSRSTWKWTAYLDKIGVLPNAWEPDVPEAAKPNESPAAWFHMRLKRDTPVAAFALFDRMADRFRADGIPVDLQSGNTICVDLLDHALESGVVVADPGEETHFDLSEWAHSFKEMPERPRDPTFVHNDKRFAKLLSRAVPKAAGSAAFEKHASGKKALKEARCEWLTDLLNSIDKYAIPHAEEAVGETAKKTYRSTFREFPEPYANLKEVRLGPVLARNLRDGLLDEYGWPVLEQAIDKLRPKPGSTVPLAGALPNVIVYHGQNVIVVNRDSVVLECEVPLPKKHEITGIAYVDGRLAVESRDPNTYKSATFWVDDPSKRFEDGSLPGGKQGAMVRLPDGNWFCGGKSFSSNDSEPNISRGEFYFDGERVWDQDYDYKKNGYVTIERDPVDGKRGRQSLPSWFEDFIESGEELMLGSSELLKLEDYVSDSPLGSKDGIVGWRVKQTAKQKYVAEGIDGRRWEGESRRVPIAMLDLPGTDQHMIVSGSYWSTGWYHRDSTLWDRSYSYRLDDNVYTRRGQCDDLPVLWWHMLQVRDLETSRRLRLVTDDQAEALIVAAQADLAKPKEKGVLREFTATRDALLNLLPGLSDNRLAHGLVHLIKSVAEQQNALGEVVEKNNPDAEDPIKVNSGVSGDGSVSLQAGLNELDVYFPNRHGKIAPHLHALGLLLNGKLPEGTIIPNVSSDWLDLFIDLPGKLWRAIQKERTKPAGWPGFIEYWLEQGIQQLPGKLRRIGGKFSYEVSVPIDYGDRDEDDEREAWVEQCPVWEEQGNTYVFYKFSGPYGSLLEYAPEGKFYQPECWEEEDGSRTLDFSLSVDALKSLAAAGHSHGNLEITRESLEEFAGTVDISFAESACFWLGGLSKEKREELKLKVKETERAADSMGGLPTTFRTHLAEFVFTDAERLWTDTAQVIRDVAQQWLKNAPKRLPLSAKMRDRLPAQQRVLDAMADPSGHPMFSTDTKYEIQTVEHSAYYSSFYVRCKNEEAAISLADLSAMVTSLLLLDAELPVGDEARLMMPAIRDALLKVLENQNLLLDCGHASNWENEPDYAKLLATVFKKTTTDDEGQVHADDDVMVALATPNKVRIGFRPASVKKQADLDAIKTKVLAACNEWDASPAVALFVRSAEFQAVCDRIQKTSVADGQYEASPFQSVPKLVQTVAAKLKVSEEAAGFYLQVLSLPEPTTANIKIWNDWKPAAIKKVVAELVKKKLILEAKRSRAGRNYFVPGGWEALDRPYLPIETWKLPMFGIERGEASLMFPLTRIVCPRPLHKQFELAWQRVVDGDEPAYEEVGGA